MNYEQKYKEALEKVRKIHRFSSNPTVIKNMEDIFPELRESEDEMIRKWLINLLSKMQYHHCDDEMEMGNKALAWLEKQGEQKSALSDEEEELTKFEKAVQSICKNLRDGIDDIGDIHILSNNLLDLARKEILKDLPKWKKFLKEYEELDTHAILLEDNERVVLTEYLEKGDYYIELEDLETLPKEE